jgi:hypothetical protein
MLQTTKIFRSETRFHRLNNYKFLFCFIQNGIQNTPKYSNLTIGFIAEMFFISASQSAMDSGLPNHVPFF